MARYHIVLAAALLSATAWPASAATPSKPASDNPGADLPYPMQAMPKAGEIVHVATGLDMSFDGMMDMVAGARLVFIGESHDNLRSHQVELRILEDLEKRFPGRIAIGMEMFRQPQQAVLDRWTAGQLSELQFREAIQWQRTWGFDFRYYRAILDFARDRHLDIVGLRPPATLESAVKAHGLDVLPDALRKQLPDIGPPDRYERAVMQAIYGAHLRTAAVFDRFFHVQLFWEEAMAGNVVAYLESPRGAGKIMVTLTGAGHVEYGYGLPRKVLRRLPLPYVIVEPSEISIPADKQMPNVKMPEIPLLPADFVWWIPYQDLDASAMHLGVMIDERSGTMVVRSISKGSPAERAGMRVGDEIVAIDGHPVPDVSGLSYWLEQQKKGGRARVTIRRDGEQQDLRVGF